MAELFVILLLAVIIYIGWWACKDEHKDKPGWFKEV